MRVVIIGAGKLGFSVAELMANEQYDVVLVDIEEARLQAARDTLDVLTIAANGASPRTMKDPDIRGADLLIAVTKSDEVNIVSCILAKQHGIHHTIARIRDTQYLREAKDYMRENFSIDLMLNPEHIMASEIGRMLTIPSSLVMEDFAEGKVRIFEAKVKSGSRWAGVKFRDMVMPKDILAAMIFRDNHMLIPHGGDALQSGDSVYFIGNPSSIEEFSTNFVEQQPRKINKVVIVGAGRTGQFLAPMLEAEGMQVKVIEQDEGRCQQIQANLTRGLVIRGDATNVELLRDEGINEADVAICLTDDDKLNLMLALLMKHLGAAKTVVRVSNNDYLELMRTVGVDFTMSSRLLSAGEMLGFARRGGVAKVSFLEGSKVEVVEAIVQRGAPVVGRSLAMAQLPAECLVCAYVREGQATIPNGNTTLAMGDRVVLIIDTRFVSKVLPYFKGRG